ncbi:MAG: S8 family serine peptidase, partial [Nanoarchaeota archaeon]
MKKYPFLFIVVILLVTIIIGISSAASPNKKTVIVLYTDDVTDEDEYDLEKIGARIKYTHKIIPAITTYVDEEDIDDIELDEDVVAVFEDMVVHTFLANSVPQIRANQVHSAGVTGSGVKVCIVDTGVDDTHPALNPLVAEHDFVNNDPDATDDHGHGTHVAGIVASTDATYKGVAYGSSLMAAKVLDATGSGFSSDVIAGIDWCVANGAKII